MKNLTNLCGRGKVKQENGDEKATRWWYLTSFRQQEKNEDGYTAKARYIIKKRSDYIALIFMCMMNMPQLQILVNSAFETNAAYYLIPVILLLFVAGLPSLYMEIFLGQYARRSPLQMWKIAPVAFGYFIFLNFLGIVLTGFDGAHPAQNLMYLYSAVVENQPWATCQEEYPVKNVKCIDSFSNKVMLNPTCLEMAWKDIINCTTPTANSITPNYSLYRFSTTQYFVKLLWTHVKDNNAMNWSFFYALTMNTIIMTVMLVTKPLYPLAALTSIILYTVFMAFLFIMTLFHSGSAKGITLMLSFQSAPILNVNNWWRALYFVIAFMNLTFPSTMSYSARIGTQCGPVLCARLLTIFVLLTAIGYTLMSFSLLGFMAKSWNVTLQTFRFSRDGFMFGTIPLGLNMLPLGNFTVVMYFFVSWFSSFMHQVCLCGGTVLGLSAFFKSDKYYRPLAFGYCIFTYIFTFSFSTSAGTVYWLSIVQNSVKSWGILTSFTIKVVLVFWIYGVPRISEDMFFMVGKNPTILSKILWSITPLIAIVIFVYQLFYAEQKVKKFMPLTFQAGTILWYVITSAIPAGLVYKLILLIRNRRPSMMVEPTMDWGPPNEALRKERKFFHPSTTIPSQPETRNQVNDTQWNAQRRAILSRRKKQEIEAGKKSIIYY